MSASTLLDLCNWYALPTTSKCCTRTTCDMHRAHAVAAAAYMSDQSTIYIHTYTQVANSLPSNFAEQLMPQLPYAAILYVLIGCTPHAQDNNCLLYTSDAADDM
eukprot:7385509-Alexandrium_andersonii.AAC.1